MDNNELLGRIEKLEEENKSLKTWQQDVMSLLSGILQMAEDQKKNNENVESQIATIYRMSKINRYRVDSLPYEIAAPDYNVDIFYPNIMSLEDTRKAVIDDRKSIARLGDGEFSAIAGVKRWNFQGESKELGLRLREILSSDVDNLLVGLNPNFYGSLQGLEENDADGVRAYMRPEVRRLHSELLRKEVLYADALFHRISSEDDLTELRRLWKGRDVVIVEGQYTRMGIGNDLLNDAKSIRRILAPSESAFNRYDDILEAAKKQPEDSLFLIALGPTATVLAYDLAKAGYWAVDIGHLDLIFEKFKRGLDSLYDVDISFKYCNRDEQGERRQIEDIKDEVYESQIVESVL